MTGIRAASGRRTTSIHAGRCLERCAGILIWRLADPSTLPVEALSAGAAGSAKRRRSKADTLLRIFGMGLGIGGFLLLAAGILGTRDVRHLTQRYITNPPGFSIRQTADELERALDQAWWRPLQPGLAPRLNRLADAIRQGRRTLMEAAVAYSNAGERMMEYGLPGRLIYGPEITRPIVEALARVSTRWHRTSLTYLHIQQVIAPYLEPVVDPSQRLVLTLKQAPPHHALLITVRNEAGQEIYATPPIPVGSTAEIPFRPGSILTLSDLTRPANDKPFQILEDISRPLEDLSEKRPLEFPVHGASFQIGFSGELAAAAPPWDRLPPAIRQELDMP
ncbi:MAG: hypothetical protein KJ970_14915 [Candidatus Eisenbacteria bacterium]|uniref:Uncharacterized protein n=1 Tax=Eiseniibacteriota bacterium TaxID=2212470 RepID=A0A948RXB5_UNCEI|nr:hypothetical protein [Candidatus Eisenbacteria bacterium]MBU1948760.1 hypothetical protein [Candidatus Eisenbacteria bacterium]MBU2692211.1 hypothetical protein [Candidatus Eisenbacteria bacterium]